VCELQRVGGDDDDDGLVEDSSDENNKKKEKKVVNGVIEVDPFAEKWKWGFP